MAARVKFVAALAGAEWKRHPELAEMCESAGLTAREAQVLMLRFSGWTLIGIAGVLGLRDPATVGRHVTGALAKVRSILPAGTTAADLAQVLGRMKVAE